VGEGATEKSEKYQKKTEK